MTTGLLVPMLFAVPRHRATLLDSPRVSGIQTNWKITTRISPSEHTSRFTAGEFVALSTIHASTAGIMLLR